MTETVSNTLHCYVHPTRETALRCKRCERPICATCAQRTPTGYLCRECVNQHKKIFDTAVWYDYLIGPSVLFVLSILASGLLAFAASFIGFYMIFVAVALAGGTGVFLANIAIRITSKRRSRPLFLACAAGVALGALPVGLFLLISGGMLPAISIGIYGVVATSTVYGRLAGIQL